MSRTSGRELAAIQSGPKKYDSSAQVGLMKMKKATDFKTILAKDPQTSLFLKQVQRRLFGWWGKSESHGAVSNAPPGRRLQCINTQLCRLKKSSAISNEFTTDLRQH